MNTQPEALRLAEYLELPHIGQNKSAAELRRLHEVNQMLMDALNEAIAYIKIQDTVKKQELRELLAKARGRT